MPSMDERDEFPMYEVFAREKLDGQLAHVGCVRAPNAELAAAQATMTYSEKPWVEMCIAPRASFLRCIGEDNEIIGYV